MSDKMATPSTSGSSVPAPSEGVVMAPGKTPAADGPVDRIKFGEYLTINQNLTSKNGEYTLSLQDNLSLCIQKKSGQKTYYYTRVGLTGAGLLTVTEGGELQILSRGGSVLWPTSKSIITDDDDGAQGAFVLNDDGSAGTQTAHPTQAKGWSTKLKPAGTQPEVSNSLAYGKTLSCGQMLVSGNGSHYLRLEPNGLLALYMANFEGSAWDSKKTTAPATGVATLSVMSNGGPAVYGSDKKSPIWKEDGKGVNATDAVLTLENNGEIVVRSSSGKELWRGGKAAPNILN